MLQLKTFCHLNILRATRICNPTPKFTAEKTANCYNLQDFDDKYPSVVLAIVNNETK